MAALLALRFPDFFQSPNSGVIEPYGDGYKVYAVMEYHARLIPPALFTRV